jgi:hypothetical protein
VRLVVTGNIGGFIVVVALFCVDITLRCPLWVLKHPLVTGSFQNLHYNAAVGIWNSGSIFNSILFRNYAHCSLELTHSFHEILFTYNFTCMKLTLASIRFQTRSVTIGSLH